MRINRLIIKGFKDPNRIVDITFSKEPISIIYGKNGSGKTTLLKIIHAILSLDWGELHQENVQEVTIYYEHEETLHTLQIQVQGDHKFVTIDGGDGGSTTVFNSNELRRAYHDDMILYETIIKNNESKGFSILKVTNSVFFGLHRGLKTKAHELNYLTIQKIRTVEDLFKEASFHKREMRLALTELSILRRELRMDFEQQADNIHLRNAKVDIINIETINRQITKQYRLAEEKLSENVQNTFLNTIANAIIIELEKESYELPDNFWDRLDSKRSFLKKVFNRLKRSQIQASILQLLEESKPAENKLLKSKIFKALLFNILRTAEKEPPALKAFNILLEVFNDHLYGEKKLIVTAEVANIQLPNGNSHELHELSSGERHLLTFLTLFLITARGRDIYLIDEPETSLHMLWQEKILPLFSELSPNSQIIAATHSPSIASKNPNYLVELT